MSDEQPRKKIRISGKKITVRNAETPQLWNKKGGRPKQIHPRYREKTAANAMTSEMEATLAGSKVYHDPNDPPMLNAQPYRPSTLATLAEADAPPQAEPWLRFPEEPTRQWRAFVAYRDLGERRSYNKTAEICGDPLPNVSFWSQRWQWTWRVECFDRYVARIAANQVANEHAEMTKRHVNLAMILQEKALKALQQLQPGELSPREILWYLKEAVAIERISRSQPAELMQTEREDQHEEASQSDEWMSDVFSILVESGALPEGTNLDSANGIVDAQAYEIHTSQADVEAGSVPADPT